MKAYTPSSLALVGLVAGVAGATLLLGLAVGLLRPGKLARLLSWVLVLASVAGTERLVAAEPAGFRMLALCTVLLFAMKAVVTVETDEPARGLRWLGFAAAWPGMRPELFRTAFGPALPGATALAVKALVRLAIGAALFGAARLVWARTGSRVAATALALPGISLVLHFGLLNLAGALWRALGVDATPLFRAPLLATSLDEFWGKRWNLAFSEMTARAVYRPVGGWLGRKTGLVAAFGFSGLLHELAISVPVQRGYGLPLLYFLLHGLLMLVEKGLLARRAPGHGHPASSHLEAPPWRGRAWTTFWLVAPILLLFHPAFLEGVVWPLLGTEGAPA